MLAALDRQAKQAAALAAEAAAGGGSGGGSAGNGKGPELRLGQRVVHRGLGYRGVVVGWDVGCCESEEWQEGVAAHKLRGGLRCVCVCVANCQGKDSRVWGGVLCAFVFTRPQAAAHNLPPPSGRGGWGVSRVCGSLTLMLGVHACASSERRHAKHERE